MGKGPDVFLDVLLEQAVERFFVLHEGRAEGLEELPAAAGLEDGSERHVQHLADVPVVQERRQGGVPDADLPALLDDRHVRQVLHVTFGSVFQAGGGQEFLQPLRAALMKDEETFYGLLRKHMERHVRPFAH
jgi:hypothetical protein